LVAGWGPANAAENPIPPQNGTLVSPSIPGVLDIRWDDPSILARNAQWTVVGVNVYRSDVSDRGPFFRLNEFPVGATLYRDRTDHALVQETVPWATGWVNRGDAPNDRRWVFRTQYPIVTQDTTAPFQRNTDPVYAYNVTDVTVAIDGTPVWVEDVFGPTGEVALINQGTFNEVTEKSDPPILPDENSVVEVSYYANRNHVQSGLGTNLFYRLTTVVIDTGTPSGYKETDLDWCRPITTVSVERLDYIWREAIRRNHWILQQGGERVNFFIRRQMGVPCSCQIEARTREYSQQPSNRCLSCYGTGFVGGYEGPFIEIIAPDDAERRIAQTPWGRRKEHVYEVFTGPSPVVTQRDFLVKQTNERYSIGGVRRPTNRGTLLQQHFNIGYLDEQDIRYQVPIDGVAELMWPQTRYGFRHAPSMPVDGELALPPSTMPDKPAFPRRYEQIPMQTQKGASGDVPDNKEQRGRTPVWESIEYVFLLASLPLLQGVVDALSRVL